jgi:hypothetical protein
MHQQLTRMGIGANLGGSSAAPMSYNLTDQSPVVLVNVQTDARANKIYLTEFCLF